VVRFLFCPSVHVLSEAVHVPASRLRVGITSAYHARCFSVGPLDYVSSVSAGIDCPWHLGSAIFSGTVIAVGGESGSKRTHDHS
jgi:hypothetical protein